MHRQLNCILIKFFSKFISEVDKGLVPLITVIFQNEVRLLTIIMILPYEKLEKDEL